MTLKEFIKQLTREILDEESSLGGEGGTGSMAGGPGMAYATPMAFAKKGQKKNAATKESERMGFKVTKGETEMPGDSKVKDYKSLWSPKKKKVKIYKESDYDAKSTYGQDSGYTAASGYTGVGGDNHKSTYYKENMKESLLDIIEQELLNEVTYGKFKNEIKYRTKNEQLHKAIREVKRKLMEIDRIVEYTSRMKQELSENETGSTYWKATSKNVAKISEMVNHLNNKIKNLQQ
jgi:hypothetical protein